MAEQDMPESAEAHARSLMSRGVCDDEIVDRTGLSWNRLLTLRAEAAVSLLKGSERPC